MEKAEVILGGAKFELRKWPLRPGCKIAGKITAIGADIVAMLGSGDEIDLRQIDFGKVAELFSDANVDLVVDILFEGLVFKNRDAARELIEGCDFEEVLSAIEPVLKHNLVFLMARLGNLKPSSATSSLPAQS